MVAPEAGADKSNAYLVANITPQELLSPPKASIIKISDLYSRVHGIYLHVIIPGSKFSVYLDCDLNRQNNFIVTVGVYVLPLVFLTF